MKSPTSMPHRFNRAFTLVELLVVIVIIAILASLAIPVTNVVMARANALRLKATMKDLQVAISNYRAEYNRFPLDPSQVGSDGESDIPQFLTDGSGDPDMINILMAKTDPGKSPNLNSRGIKFIDLPLAKNGLFGYIDSGEDENAALKLVDIWGMPYYVLLDTNYDNRVENPDTSNNDQTVASKAPQYLSASSAFFSSGPDKTPQTKDDVVSWR
jgi:prepilin-type N-terminal cleavage/methylation domain-containing protein